MSEAEYTTIVDLQRQLGKSEERRTSLGARCAELEQSLAHARKQRNAARRQLGESEACLVAAEAEVEACGGFRQRLHAVSGMGGLCGHHSMETVVATVEEKLGAVSADDDRPSAYSDQLVDHSVEMIQNRVSELLETNARHVEGTKVIRAEIHTALAVDRPLEEFSTRRLLTLATGRITKLASLQEGPEWLTREVLREVAGVKGTAGSAGWLARKAKKAHRKQVAAREKAEEELSRVREQLEPLLGAEPGTRSIEQLITALVDLKDERKPGANLVQHDGLKDLLSEAQGRLYAMLSNPRPPENYGMHALLTAVEEEIAKVGSSRKGAVRRQLWGVIDEMRNRLYALLGSSQPVEDYSVEDLLSAVEQAVAKANSAAAIATSDLGKLEAVLSESYECPASAPDIVKAHVEFLRFLACDLGCVPSPPAILKELRDHRAEQAVLLKGRVGSSSESS